MPRRLSCQCGSWECLECAGASLEKQPGSIMGTAAMMFFPLGVRMQWGIGSPQYMRSRHLLYRKPEIQSM